MTPKVIAIIVGVFLFLAVSMAVMVTRGDAGVDHVKQYQGFYRWGHEINEFCPIAERRCYGVSPLSQKRVREKLQAWAQASEQTNSAPICVIVGAKPDTYSEASALKNSRELLLITDVLGRC